MTLPATPLPRIALVLLALLGVLAALYAGGAFAQVEGDRGIAPLMASTDINVGGIDLFTTVPSRGGGEEILSFATGPGGVLVFAPDGTHLGTIETGQKTANCGFGDDGSVLYMMADMFFCRIKLNTRGLGF